MPGLGVEPRWPFGQGILSPSRLTSFATPATDGVTTSQLHRRIAAVPREADATKAEKPAARTACAAQTGLLPHNPVTSELRRAGNGTRTRDPNLGKVVLYQLSYSRIVTEATRSDGVLQAS